jgi:murein L,D-transpeptidase YcbB/YkuD
MKVVVGQAPMENPSGDHKTPLLHGQLEYLLFHPYWKVPSKIVWTEIIPEAQADPRFLASQDYELITPEGSAVTANLFDPVVLRKIRDGKLEVRQKPGPENSLGTVKFVFPNPYGVYIHGTPDKELFEYSRRDFSHGCIRVDNPSELAEWLLRKNSFWTTDRIRAAIQEPVSSDAPGGLPPSSRPVLARLRKPMPFFTVYQTAVVKENNEVYFFEDIYSLNPKLDFELVNSYQHSPSSEFQH